MAITGGCACGAVRYAIEAEPVVTRVCWCRACQFTGGGNTPVNAVFKTEDVQIEGALADFTSQADSGNRVHRRSARNAARPSPCSRTRARNSSACAPAPWTIRMPSSPT